MTDDTAVDKYLKAPQEYWSVSDRERQYQARANRIHRGRTERDGGPTAGTTGSEATTNSNEGLEEIPIDSPRGGAVLRDASTSDLIGNIPAVSLAEEVRLESPRVAGKPLPPHTPAGGRDASGSGAGRVTESPFSRPIVSQIPDSGGDTTTQPWGLWDTGTVGLGASLPLPQGGTSHSLFS